MRKGRWRGLLAALAATAAGAGGLAGPVPTVAAAEVTLTPVAWICYLDEGSEEGEKLTEAASIETVDGRKVLAMYHVLCTNTVEEEDGSRPELDLSYFRDHFPGMGVFTAAAVPDGLTFVQCGERGGTLGAASAGAPPTVDDLRRDCSLEVPKGAASGSGGGGLGGMGGDFGGGMMWGSGDGMPTSDSLDCGGGGALANPWAAETSGGGGKTNGQLAWQMFKQWASGVGIAYGGAKSASSGGTGGVVGTGGALAAFDNWAQSVADTLGKDLEQRYRDYAGSLAEQAAGFADQAEKDAMAVATAAPGTPENVASAEAAQKARAAAEAAAKAAEVARTSSDRGEIGAAYRAALKATEDAKKAAEDAKKAKDSATGGSTTPPPPPGDSGMPGGTDQSREACEQLRQQLWECEQSGWKTYSCQQLANMIRGCKADSTVALVGEDGQLCGSPYLDPDAVQAALDRACGLEISKYGPDDDPCGGYVDGVAPQTHYDGCDPTVAFGGCPPETGETVALPEKGVTCFEVPSKLPPLPCFDTGSPPGGGPVLGYVVDSAGTLYVPGRGGILAVGNLDPGRLPPYTVGP